MKRVLTAVVLIPIVLAFLFRAPEWLFTVFVALVALLTLHEYLGLAAAHGLHPSRPVLFLAFAVWFLLLAGIDAADDRFLVELGAIGVMFLLLLLTAPLLMALAMRAQELREALPSAATGVLALPYIAFSLGSMVGVRSDAWGKFLLLYLLVVVWSGDTAAYYVGRAWGRRKLAPRLSPGKTWEGTLASLLGSTALGTLMFVFAPAITGLLLRARLLLPGDAAPSPALLSPPIWTAVLLSAAINVAAQFGDLAESAMKRGAGVKDSGSLLPGHGGMLDRVDALLFAAPVLCYYAAFRHQLLAPYLLQ